MSDSDLKLIVLARDQSPRVQNAWIELSQFLERQTGVEVVAAEVTEELDLDGLEADLVIVLGGDGAILRASRHLGSRQIPLLGINLGRLGFLADLSPEDFRENFHQIRTRNYQVVEHLMFVCELRQADGTTDSILGLNEAAISAASSLRMIDLHLAIDDEPVTVYSGDGLIVSTPVGSTAHNLSSGGPILRQSLQAFVITPICPHTLTNRPLVDSADCIFTLTAPDAPDGTMLVVDGQIRRLLKPGAQVTVRRADVTFKLAKIPGHSYYTMLRQKLGWGGQARYRF